MMPTKFHIFHFVFLNLEVLLQTPRTYLLVLCILYSLARCCVFRCFSGSFRSTSLNAYDGTELLNLGLVGFHKNSEASIK